MARRLRVVYEGALYHVTFRGNGREAIFADERDRERFVESLVERVARYRVGVHLYVLMSNHVHLLVETPEANLPAFMGSLLTSYATYRNRRHRRVGHLTQGRYGAQLVEGDAYLLRLSRYIHQNPVWVRSLAKQPLKERIEALRKYRWSSYRAYAGLTEPEAWVRYAPIWELTTGRPDSKAATRYRQFVEAGLGGTDEELKALVQDSGLAIGSEQFCNQVRDRHVAATSKHRRREDVALRRDARHVAAERLLAGVCRHFGIPAEGLLRRRPKDQIRPAAAALLVQLGGLTQREVAHRLGLSTGAAVCLQLQRLKRPEFAAARAAVAKLAGELTI